MKFYEKFERNGIRSWVSLEDLEENTYQQAVNLANHPIVVNDVALMPDAHLGYGMPIGGVIATHGGVIPNAVGSDIGCGMSWIQTDILAKEISNEVLEKIRQNIKIRVPIISHSKPQEWDSFNASFRITITEEIENAKKQLGTLGRGNHFIELQEDKSGFLCAMIHSGSRHLGKAVNEHFHGVAVYENSLWKSNIPTDDLAFLPMIDFNGQQYMECMNFCLDYAKENRRRMMNVVEDEFIKYLDALILNRINIHHNYAAYERRFGKNVIIHRKGATSAKEGEYGIIPGSMSTPSYIVKGKGNPLSYNSCSHGAGRVMGRVQASRTLDVEECEKKMEGILWDGFKMGRKKMIDLGEAGDAYKDIDKVIESQSDLIEVVNKLKPLGVIKG